MRKLLLLVLLVVVSVSANAQLYQRSTDSTTGFESKWTRQFDVYVQDCWGVGLTARKELSPNLGWNVIGASFMSGWHNLDSPDKAGLINVRLSGIRLNAPVCKNLKIYAEANPGYTYGYVEPISYYYYGYYNSYTSLESAHCFGLDCSAGVQLFDKVVVGYNNTFLVNGNGNGCIHWGRISILF